MSLESRLDELLPMLLNATQTASRLSARQIISCIDLTLLDKNASHDALQELKKQALSHQVAAVCVLIPQLTVCSSQKIKLATVINFPEGEDDLNLSLEQVVEAKTLGATEIDYVLPYKQYLSVNKRYAIHCCNTIIKACQKEALTSKVIIETGAFPDMQSIYQVSRELIETGCNFLKTSTGKIPKGASIHAAFSILSAIRDAGTKTGIKLSGGVKTPTEARQYALLAELMMGRKIKNDWFRIGASSLLDALLI